MKILTNCIGLMAVFCVIGGADAALRAGGSRVSSIPVNATTAAARRLPTMISAKNVATTTTTTTTSTSSLMEMTECVEKYTECIKDADVCGFDFEECTTPELFYAKKPQCNNVLLQCSAAGINALFGTTSTTNLSAKNSNDEYVYPTAGSILGQFIEAGAINNRLDKSSCVKRYTSCLKKESVCGEDFELCTSNNEFKKQKIFCESTLARCMDDGKTELFGSTNIDSNPTATSRLGIMIKEGAQLATLNAVSTCYKVADQCILAACSANPYKCIANSSDLLSQIVDKINEGGKLTAEEAAAYSSAWTTSDVSKYIKSACHDTIGGNKYCYMTMYDGKLPSASELIDEDNRDEIYADVSAKRKVAVESEIQKLANKFDTRAKDKCRETISACAMRSCGSGLGSACYKKVFGTSRDLGNSINGESTYTEIQRGCAAIVNTDANCQYAAAASNATAYNYTYSDANTFTILFPTQDEAKDPIGVVEELTGLLADNYNDAAIERMGKQCRNTAVSCIRSLCGEDFVNCYRNRTDIMTDTYATDETKFNQSMNKVGGVLDFTIVRGLCLETVKSADVCDEHLKIQSILYNTDNGVAGWGDKSSVREAWVDAVKDGYSAKAIEIEGEFVETGLCTIDQSKAQNAKCKEKITNAQECNTVDEDGCLYDVEQVVARKDYQVSMAADTLFQEVMGDLEKEAQAKYNAKLTAEQHMCVDANNGGIMGRNDHSSTYMWVKLKNRKVPKNYSTNGLAANDFVASNDLYGSFCRARVTIQSDDPDIQSALQQKNQNWSTAYFAVGDVFTCGSWIPQDKLQEIAEKVAAKKLGKSVEDARKGKMSTGQKWATAAATIGGVGLGGVGGAYLADSLQSGNMLGGLLQRNRNSNSQNAINVTAANSCASHKRTFDGAAASTKDTTRKGAASSMYYAASRIVDNSGVVAAATKAVNEACISKYDESACEAAVTSLYGVCNSVAESGGQYAGYDNNTRRTAINLGSAVLGATGGGLTAGFATGKNIKAANRQRFTEAQQEFMNNVGNHIYCFIGADEAGTYGDLIEISVD